MTMWRMEDKKDIYFIKNEKNETVGLDDYDFLYPTMAAAPPPPSPQEQNRLESYFKQPLTEYSEHAHTLDRLLRRTLNTKIGKKKRKWTPFGKRHKLMKVLTSNDGLDLFDEETTRITHELREMVL
ncbi:hypothetical protein BY458DRAFT_495199 [Sporodiniella umbellata]|nr:hypothetical protein BY458DRAFT_495199 [Sporodiniella umbellata]